jgi:MFS family permease
MVSKKHVSKEDMMHALLIGSIFHAIAIPSFGWIADKIGIKKLFLYGCICSAIVAYPILYLIQSGHYLIGFIIAYIFGNAFTQAALPTAIPKFFPTGVRYTGSSLAMQIAVAIGLAGMPVLGIAIAMKYDLTYVTGLIILTTLITYYASRAIPEHK